MITSQDIQEKAFERAGKGYNMEQVDEFLDELAADFATLSKENAALKSKMKVLVQKVDEYRQTEDSMRLAFLSAQKVSAQMEADAKEKADAVMAEAQDYANKLKKETEDGMANEEAKLEEAKKATNRFFDHMRTVCQKQIEFYDKLSQMQLIGGEEPKAEEKPAEEPEAQPDEPGPAKPVDVEETVRSIAASAAEAALDEPGPEQEAPEAQAQEPDEPTRLFSAGGKGRDKKRKRSFDDLGFDDDI